MIDGATAALDRIGVPVYGHRFGAKGCLVFNSQPVRNYREFLAVDGYFSHAHWLIQHNGGVFLPPWGKSEQWTLSAQHSLEDADRFVTNVERMPTSCPNSTPGCPTPPTTASSDVASSPAPTIAELSGVRR